MSLIRGWDNNYNNIDNLNDVIIPDGFDLYSLLMSEDILSEIKQQDLEIPKLYEEDESEIEEVIGGMQKIRVSSIFEKYIPKNDWYMFFTDEMVKEYFKTIEEKYLESIKNEIEIYPKMENIFRAFNLTSLKNIKVVIIGQAPYPSRCQNTKVPYANGLAFSVNKECTIPASLKNIYKELEYEGFNIPKTGDLEHWGKQGVLLLNTQLSVEKRNPNSHKFWQQFTDNVIKHICGLDKRLVFVLMGENALKKYKLIPKNTITKFVITSHPSLLDFTKKLHAYPPFYHSNIFKNINKKLIEMEENDIKW